MDDKLYYVYIIRCIDNSLYTGITTDVKRRFSEHTSRRSIGEKYTRSRKAISIEAVWSCVGRSCASKFECAIKKLSKQYKEKLISEPSIIYNVFSGNINPDLYKYVSELKNSLINE